MQLTEHIHMIRIPFQLSNGSGLNIDRFVHVYIICGQEICLIDTGVASSFDMVREYIRECGRDPREISLIVQTHTHADHTGATRLFQEATGAAVMMHPAEQAWLENPDLQFRERPVPGFFNLVSGAVKADRLLEDGDTVNLDGGLDLAVFHTPGHSNGSLSFLLRADGTLFCGDAVPVPGDIPVYDDVPLSVSSLKRLRKTPGLRLLLSSWAEPQEGDRAYQALDEGLQYLQKIHEAVLKAAGKAPYLSRAAVKRVLTDLNMPADPANPLLTRSLAAHLRVRNLRDLLAE